MNDSSPGSCFADCSVAVVCGDTIVAGTEVCDDGVNDNSQGSCTSDCLATVFCGNGAVTGTEVCDDGTNNNTPGSCLADCSAAVICGDNAVIGTEVCDDGVNDNTPGSCLADCSAAVICGDNAVTGTEVCDDGVNDNTPGSCLADCSATVVCGDNITNGTEACDDGNLITEACLYGEQSCVVCDATCSSIPGLTSYCGDGATDIGNAEVCDDGNLIDTDGCSNTCNLVAKRVFTTSQTTTAGFGGLAGGDLHCQTLANAASLPGTYKAWISDSTGSPSTRFTRGGPYQLVDGTLIANDWADLTDGSIANPINLTESSGTPPDGNSNCGDPRVVWSNTLFDGTLLGNGHCADWTGGNGDSEWSRWDLSNQEWSAWCTPTSGATCNNWVANLYCFEQ